MRQLGYLGKVPHRGDFVRYNIPTQLHGVWSDWLGEVLLHATRTLEGWPSETDHDRVSVWQFALSPDIAGSNAYAGVLLTSCDSVGRRFPFALFATLPEAMTPLETLASNSALDSLERLACEAVTSADDYERLKMTLGELQETLSTHAFDSKATPFRPGASADMIEPAVFSENAELLADRAGTTRLLDAVLRQSSGPYSVWRCRHKGAVNGGLLISGGLPQGAAALTLLGAEWSARAGGRLDDDASTDTLRPQRPSLAPTTSAGTAQVPGADEETPIDDHRRSDAVDTITDKEVELLTRAEHSAETERDPESTVSMSDGANLPTPTNVSVDADRAARVPGKPPIHIEPLKIEDEEGDAPWDAP